MYYMDSRQEENRKYNEAKSDMKKAIKSFDALTPQQKKQLFEELVLEQTITALLNEFGYNFSIM